MSETQLIEERPDYYLLHAHCHECASSVLFAVFLAGSQISSFGLVTDLSCEDALRLRAAKAISLDDVLDLHKQLAQ